MSCVVDTDDETLEQRREAVVSASCHPAVTHCTTTAAAAADTRRQSHWYDNLHDSLVETVLFGGGEKVCTCLCGIIYLQINCYFALYKSPAARVEQL